MCDHSTSEFKVLYTDYKYFGILEQKVTGEVITWTYQESPDWIQVLSSEE